MFKYYKKHSITLVHKQVLLSAFLNQFEQ